jgi:lipopolysaccharide transport system ATP-binding protein
MNSVVLDLNNIGVYYRKVASLPWKSNKFWALQAVSFRVYQGETLGVIGRNGAGKSTLLKVLAGIIRPDTGSIQCADMTMALQSVGAGFDPRLTGRQNIFLNGLLLGMDKSRITLKTDEIIALADIGEFIDEPVKHYSSGMRARLGFSIAYYVDTDIILIDEALATGDHAFREKASALIKEKIRSKRTVVLVTHSMHMINQLCDRVIHIEAGCTLPELPVEKSVDRYMNTGVRKIDVQ